MLRLLYLQTITDPSFDTTILQPADENRLDYWGEHLAIISLSGTRVLFGSDMSGLEDGQSVDSYVVELPANNEPQ